jgi:hypothetical protein
MLPGSLKLNPRRGYISTALLANRLLVGETFLMHRKLFLFLLLFTSIPACGADYSARAIGISDGDLPKSMWSSYRAQQKARDKKQAGGEEPARMPRTAASKLASNGEGDIISDLEALKPLMKELGPEKVKRLVDVLG